MNTIYKSIIPDNTLKLIELSMLIIRNEFPDINSHTKVRFLKFLTTNNIYINQILSYESKNISLESYIKSLTSFYIQIDKEGEEAQYYDKMPVRYSINNVFVYFINISPYHNDKTTYNIDIYNALESDKNFEKFLYILISDCIHYIEEIIASITKIKSASAANQTAKHYLEQQESSVETNKCLEQLNAIVEVHWCQRQHPAGVRRISDRPSKPRQLLGHPRPTVQQPIADAINGNHQRKTHKNQQVQEDA